MSDQKISRFSSRAEIWFFLSKEKVEGSKMKCVILSGGLGRLIWTSPGKQVFSVMMFQRVCSLIYGLFVQAYRPAGPDGIRE
jgi:hypothetical protein